MEDRRAIVDLLCQRLLRPDYDAGTLVPAGTYRWTFTVTAMDGTGAATNITGTAKPTGTVKVTRVDEKISFAEPLQGNGFERGQWLVAPDALPRKP